MSVNREARDRCATTLADYMRGRITNLDLSRVIEELPADDRSVNALVWNVWCLYDDFRPHPLRCTKECWDLLSRALVFMRTDLEMPQPLKRRRWLHWRQAPALLVLASLAAAYAWSPSPLVLPALWVASGIGLYWPPIRRRPPIDTGPDWYPFENEEQWRRHEHLAASSDLPPYDAARCDPSVPIRSPMIDRLRLIPGTLLLIAAAPLMLLLVCLPRLESCEASPGTG